MGKGAKVRVASGPWDATSLKGTTQARGWPFYWLDLPARPILGPSLAHVTSGSKS